ncbi:hypothetical protein KKD62_00020 [Patescibacteria group bacterium]|nr:hypothetical protein [Patescibacteria group bacterium]MBU1931915.1 hypothetical protein [Patescibacteria group bacterium]
MKNKNWLAVFLILTTVLLYYRSFLTYFIGGDDIWLYLSAPDSFSHVVKLFSDIGGTYRPIPFSLFRIYWLFGTNVQLMHIIPIILHCLNTVLIYFLLQRFNQSKLASGIVSLAYGFSHIVFFDVFTLTGLVDQIFILFFLLSLCCFFNKRTALSLVFFILTIFCKESFISLTIILTAAWLIFPRSEKHPVFLEKVTPGVTVLLTGIYLAFKLVFYRQQGSAYSYIFNLKTLLNNLFDYGLWLINWRHGWQMGMPFSPDKFYDVFSFIYLLLLIFAVIKTFKTNKKVFVFALVFGLAGLVPFYFLGRALTFYLEISLIGLCILLAGYVKTCRRKNLVFALLLFLTFYFSINIKTQWLEYSHAARGVQLAKTYFDQVVQAYDWNQHDQLCLVAFNDDYVWATAVGQELNMFFKRADGKKIEIVLVPDEAGLLDCSEQSLVVKQE